MSQINCIRKGCIDVFHAFMVQNATYEGKLEIPSIASESLIPVKLIPFSKAIGGKDLDAWVHFYEDDAVFERLWQHPKRYLPILKRYRGVIAPDFSLYRDMPLVMQYWNIYRSHAIAVWLQDNDIPVIANVRWGDERSYKLCCCGVPKNATIAIGSHGCIKLLEERKHFEKGLEYVIRTLRPKVIIIYGSAPEYIFRKYKCIGIKIVQFDSAFASAHRKEVEA